jgi:hypothetical protein
VKEEKVAAEEVAALPLLLRAVMRKMQHALLLLKGMEEVAAVRVLLRAMMRKKQHAMLLLSHLRAMPRCLPVFSASYE